MQFFDRSIEPPPKSLYAPVARGARLRLLEYFQLDPSERAQTRPSGFTVSLDEIDIKFAIGRLFLHKCAFCETELIATQAYRFRPSSSAMPEAKNAHIYYSWLATAWENIYPICKGCLPRQREYFPVAGKRARLPSLEQLRLFCAMGNARWGHYPIDEKALLLDPCRKERFYNHFFTSISGTLMPRSARGQTTIQHFSLNRRELVAARKARLESYRAGLLTLDLIVTRRYEDKDFPLFEFTRMEFGGLWYLQCRLMIAHLSTAFGRRLDDSRSRIGESFKWVFNQPDFAGYHAKLMAWIDSADFGNRLTSEKSQPKGGESKPVKDGGAPPTYPALISIELQNFKAIEHLKLHLAQPSSESMSSGEPQQPAMLILGENATGKSSILEATALALSSVHTRNLLKMGPDEWVLDPTQLGGERELRLPSSQIRLGFDNQRESVLDIEDGPWKPLRAQTVPPVLAYGAFRQFKKSTLTYESSHCILNLFHSDELLPDPEPWLVGLAQPGDFDTVARALRLILAVQGEFSVIRKSSDGKCQVVTRHAGEESLTPLSQVSSGYRAVLAMACDIMRRLMDPAINPHYQSLENARAVVLIDEVEAHLHPRWKIQIMGALRTALPKVTFIATSHDPLCVRGMYNHEVVVMHRTARELNEAARHPVRIEQLTDLPDITQMTVEQLLTSDFFSLGSTDQPLMNLKLATVADLLSKSNDHREGELGTDDQAVVALFKQQINDVLPVGTTEGQRLVQTAVAEFLQDRSTASSERLKALNVKAKAKIRSILEGF